MADGTTLALRYAKLRHVLNRTTPVCAAISSVVRGHFFFYDRRNQKKRTGAPTTENKGQSEKVLCGRGWMKLPYVVRWWAETHSRAAYLITGRRIIHFKQHLSFLLLPLCLQQTGINKPICTEIINHYPDPWPVSRACWQRLQFTKVVFYFASPLGFFYFPNMHDQTWFMSPDPTGLWP